MNAREIAEANTIYRCISGSRSYGTDTEQSDTDVRGVFISPPEVALSCFQNLDQAEYPDRDEVLFDLKKFVKLAADCNPNIIELLYTDPEHILFIDPAFVKLRENRHLFLSKKAKFTFAGYAMSQMKRIKSHHKWINNPQLEDAPDLLDFAKLILPNGNVVDGHAVESFLNAFLVKINAMTFNVCASAAFSKPALSKDRQNIQHVDVSPEKLAQVENLEFYGTLVIQEEAYKASYCKWKEYWEWKKNRNEARSELEEKHGFDTKHAMHLMRLLRMGCEILQDGKVNVSRPDAEELLNIRNGSLTYSDLLLEALRLDSRLDDLYETSSLPNSADKNAIDKLYREIVQEYWSRTG
jgi:predicted nucleotidyltransferase